MSDLSGVINEWTNVFGAVQAPAWLEKRLNWISWMRLWGAEFRMSLIRTPVTIVSRNGNQGVDGVFAMRSASDWPESGDEQSTFCRISYVTADGGDTSVIQPRSPSQLDRQHTVAGRFSAGRPSAVEHRESLTALILRVHWPQLFWSIAFSLQSTRWSPAVVSCIVARCGSAVTYADSARATTPPPTYCWASTFARSAAREKLSRLRRSDSRRSRLQEKSQ